MPEKKIPMFEVESSNMSAAGYDPNTRTLRVRFKGNAMYDYTNVEPVVFSELMGSDSKGRYFIQNIKAKYPCTKLEKEQ